MTPHNPFTFQITNAPIITPSRLKLASLALWVVVIIGTAVMGLHK
jgi:hypothetical protein